MMHAFRESLFCKKCKTLQRFFRENIFLKKRKTWKNHLTTNNPGRSTWPSTNPIKNNKQYNKLFITKKMESRHLQPPPSFSGVKQKPPLSSNQWGLFISISSNKRLTHTWLTNFSFFGILQWHLLLRALHFWRSCVWVRVSHTIDPSKNAYCASKICFIVAIYVTDLQSRVIGERNGVYGTYGGRTGEGGGAYWGGYGGIQGMSRTVHKKGTK